MVKNNIWWTRQSRIQAERRLLSNLYNAELLLIWYSLWSVLVSIYLLESKDTIPQYLFISFSVMTLAVSLYVNAQSYKDRASRIKACYEKLGLLYQKYDSSKNEVVKPSRDEYLECLDMCENHLSIDYYRAIVLERYLSSVSQKDNEFQKNTKEPNLYVYGVFYIHFFGQLLLKIVLYGLPIILFGWSKGLFGGFL